MAWLEIHQSLPTHRKTLVLADALGIEPVAAVGHLVCLWLWALDNAPDGSLARVRPRAISRAAQWKRDPDKFLSALVEAEYVVDEMIHDWADYAGRLLERRRKDADRKRTERGQSSPVPPPSNGRPADIQGTSVASRARVTVHNSTEPNRTEPIPPIPNGMAPPRKSKHEDLTDGQRLELVAKWTDDFGSAVEVQDEIDQALNHKGRLKCVSEKLYVDKWLRREIFEFRPGRRSTRLEAVPDYGPIDEPEPSDPDAGWGKCSVCSKRCSEIWLTGNNGLCRDCLDSTPFVAAEGA